MEIAATAKTLFVISVTTAKMFFPGMPQTDAAKTLRLDLTSPKKIGASARVVCAVPKGISARESINLLVTQTNDEAAQSAGRTAQSTPKLRIYWGCSNTVPDGQPKVIDPASTAPAAPPKDASEKPARSAPFLTLSGRRRTLNPSMRPPRLRANILSRPATSGAHRSPWVMTRTS